jgi:hypothetical protein
MDDTGQNLSISTTHPHLFTTKNRIIMKKQFLFLSILIFSTSIGLFTACKRDAAITPATSDLLTRAPWKLVKEEERLNQGPWTDYSFWTPCYADDLFVFKTNGQYELNEGATKCSPNDQQVIEFGSWALGNNNTEIKFHKDNGPVSAVEKIERLDETSLVLINTEVTGSNTYYTRFTYAH